MQKSYWCGENPSQETDIKNEAEVVEQDSEFFETPPVGIAPSIRIEQLRKVQLRSRNEFVLEYKKVNI